MHAAAPRDRLKGALAALIVQVALGWLLVVGLATSWHARPDPALSVFRVLPAAPPPPPDPVVPDPVRSVRPEGAAAPPNLRSEATEIVVPPPIVPPPEPPPIVAATTAGTGADATTGAAPLAGPGTGAGGVGDGTGSGRFGDGDGGGGSETPPRWRSGRLKDSDYPSAAGEGGFQGSVGVRYLVATTGRATGCAITRSSGNAELDATTCRLIEKRFRFDPSRDARGRPVPAAIVETHSWVVEDEPATPTK